MIFKKLWIDALYFMLYSIKYKKERERSGTMLAVNYSTIRSRLKEYCDRATDDEETIIVTRKEEKNVVIISLEKYNQLQKQSRNAEYLAKLDRGIAQLSAGKGQQHELIEDDKK